MQNDKLKCKITTQRINRVILIILDGLGIGELPDARDYGDEGSNTLANTARAVGGLSLPNLEQFGLGYLGDFKGIGRVPEPSASFGRMKEASKGKDTTTGHWEIAGVILDRPFPVYHEGFPPEIIKAFKKKIGKGILGNIPASGTEIIKELGEEHMRTGFPIVYTSADSVFQIAAHEEVIPVEELYKMCEIARRILKPPHNVCRVIARPFTGRPGSFERTPRRKDFSLRPPEDTLLYRLSKKDFPVVGIGKIWDLFAGKGVTKVVHTKNNMDGVDKLLQEMEVAEKGLIFINLIDFDTLYGHRNDSIGYARALKEFDDRIPEILSRMRDEDLLVITADHGCDPTTPSTDHSREHVPVLVYGKRIRPGIDIGTRESFADLGQTIAEALGIRRMKAGRSFWKEIKSR